MKTNADGSITLSAGEIDTMIARCETEIDWIRAAATTPEDVERQIAEDPELAVPANSEETILAGLFPPRRTR